MTALRRLWFPEMPAERLAVLRILVGIYGVVYVLSRLFALVGVVRYPVAQFRPVGLATLVTQPVPAVLVYIGVGLALLSGVAFTLGWRFRISGPVYAVALLWVTSYRNSWGMVFHTENLLVMHTIVLALGRSAAAYSLDAEGTRPPPDDGRYGWPVALMCAVTAGAYFIAGFTKLSNAGLAWVTSDTLLNFVAYDNVRKIELGDMYSPIGGWLVSQPWLFKPLAAVSLAVELLAPLTLLSRRLGRAWSVAAWGFHVGVLVMMFIFFHYPLIGMAFVPFFDVERLGRWVKSRWGRVPRVPD